MGQTDLLQSSRDRIWRAQYHIEEFHRRAGEFFLAHPDTGFVESDPQTGWVFYKARINPLPREFWLMVAEISEHLRAALDHIGWASTFAATGVQFKSGVYFPFCREEGDIDGFRKGKKARCKELLPEIWALFSSYKPHRTRIDGSDGNVVLWAINELANVTKHRTVVQPAVEMYGQYIERSIYTSGVKIHVPPLNAPGKDEITLASIPPGAQFQHYFKPAFTIKLANVEGIEGRDAVRCLRRMAEVVTEIVEESATICAALGLSA